MPDIDFVRKLTRDSLLKLDQTGDKDRITCLVCHEVLEIPNLFIPVRQWNIKGDKLITIKSKKQLVREFQEKHLAGHLSGKF